MPTLAEFKYTNKLTHLWKGISGTRKTTQLGWFPTPMYIFLFDGEDKISPLLTHTPIDKTKVEFDFFDNESGFERAFHKMNSLRQSCPFRTVVVDSYTMMIRRLLSYSRKKRGTSKGSVMSLGGLQEMNTLEDYNAESTFGDQFVSDLLTLKCQHAILICHVEGAERDKAGNLIQRLILSAGKKLAARLPTPFSEILHFDTRQGVIGPEYFVLTRNSGLDFARTSIEMPPEIDLLKTNVYAEYFRGFKAIGVDLDVWK